MHFFFSGEFWLLQETWNETVLLCFCSLQSAFISSTLINACNSRWGILESTLSFLLLSNDENGVWRVSGLLDGDGSTTRGAPERQPDHLVLSFSVSAPRTSAACALSSPGVTWKQTWSEMAAEASLRAQPAAPGSYGTCPSAARAPVPRARMSFRWHPRRLPWACGLVSALWWGILMTGSSARAGWEQSP